MSIRNVETLRELLAARGPTENGGLHIGHSHFWERAMSRRQFVKTATGAAGLALGAGIFKPDLALAKARRPAPSDPRPIPGGIQPFPGGEIFHVFEPVLGNEPSTITDFNGSIGITNLRGMGTGTDTVHNTTERLIYDVDMRFMQGIYFGVDGRQNHGTFGFI